MAIEIKDQQFEIQYIYGLFENAQIQCAQKQNREAYIDIRSGDDVCSATQQMNVL
ncbi:MAG: hypothetical protein ABSD50_05395 [Smithella sp.]